MKHISPMKENKIERETLTMLDILVNARQCRPIVMLGSNVLPNGTTTIEVVAVNEITNTDLVNYLEITLKHVKKGNATVRRPG